MVLCAIIVCQHTGPMYCENLFKFCMTSLDHVYCLCMFIRCKGDFDTGSYGKLFKQFSCKGRSFFRMWVGAFTCLVNIDSNALTTDTVSRLLSGSATDIVKNIDCSQYVRVFVRCIAWSYIVCNGCRIIDFRVVFALIQVSQPSIIF